MTPEMSPSIVCCNGTLEKVAATLNHLHFPRLHIDVTDGANVPGLIPIDSFANAERQLFEAPIDLHIFDFGQRWTQERLPVRIGDSVVFHLFQWATKARIRALAAKQLPEGVNKGVSIDVQVPLDIAQPVIGRCEVVAVMGIDVGGRSLPLNVNAIERLQAVRELKQGRARLIIDGGVNVNTFPRLAHVADTIIIGSLLFNAPHLEAQWSHLQQWLHSITNSNKG